MSTIKINDQFVDEAFSPIIEEALFAESVFVPNKTYTPKYQEIAGKIYVHKQVKGAVTAGAPGRDFSGVKTETTLVEILADQNFMKERKMYQVEINSIKFDNAASNYTLTTKEIAEGRERVALAKMALGSTDAADTTALTSENIKSKFLGLRKAVRKNKARADFAIVSPDVYTLILGDTTNYTPIHNENLMANGMVGKYYGIPIFESNALDNETLGFNGTENTHDLTAIDIIMGQNDGFAIFDNLVAARLIPADDFVGLRAQVEMNSGFKVVNSDKLIAKFNDTFVTEPEA